MSDVAYITNAAATLAFTAELKTVTVTGTNPILEGVLRGDRAVDPNGVELAIDVVAAGSLTLLRNAPTSGTVQFDVAPVSRLRTSNAANAEVTREVYAKLLAAAEDNRSIPVISLATAPPGSPADGDRHLVIATATGAFAGKEGYIAQYDAANARQIFIPPVAGMKVTIDEASTLLIYTGSQWLLAGADALGGFRNLLINPLGSINQRAAASNTDDTYGPDRWTILTQTGAVACSVISNVENGLPSMIRLTQSQATAQRMGLEQIVESANCRHLRGRKATLSGRVRASAALTLRYAILEWTGTVDGVTSDVVSNWTSGTYSAGNFFLSSNLVVSAVGSLALAANTLTDLAPITATLAASMNNLIAFVWTEGAVAQNVTVDAALQLERGGGATERELRSIGQELSLCMRYYQQVGTARLFGQVQNATTVLLAVPLNPPMRAAPSATLLRGDFNSASFDALIGGSWRSSSGLAVGSVTAVADFASISINGFSGLTAGQVMTGNGSAPAFAISAEL